MSIEDELLGRKKRNRIISIRVDEETYKKWLILCDELVGELPWKKFRTKGDLFRDMLETYRP